MEKSRCSVAIFGLTTTNSPDSDGDGLPDGLELGLRIPLDQITSTTNDTNGDGFNNFISDLDPPFYNTLIILISFLRFQPLAKAIK